MRDSRKRQKSGSLHSLPAGSARRSLPGRSGLPGVAVATGLALLLSACGGGGAGAPNAAAVLGGSASSIQAAAAVAPAPIVEKAAPVARNTPPAAGNTPPDAKNTASVAGITPPPTARNTPPTPEEPPRPIVVETPPPVSDKPSPPGQESPGSGTSRYVVTDPSTLPFPSQTDETIDINTLGLWGLEAYQPGGRSAGKNNGPHVVVRRRRKIQFRALTLPVSGGSGTFAYDSLYYGGVHIRNTWLTYPADAGDGDLAVHVRARKVNPSKTGQKVHVMDWLLAAAEYGPYYGFTIEDFFETGAYLQAPGSAVQPAPQGSETSATWTGQVIAFNSASNDYLNRGKEIGGDATITVNFGADPTVDVWLSDLRSAWTVSGSGPTEPNGGFSPYRYPNQRWTGLALTGGWFSDDSPGRSLEGTFRNNVSSTGTNANTVGGIFDVVGTIKGGFVATIAPPTPGF